MQKTEKKQTLVMDFFKILFLMYFVTMILLMLLALALFKLEITELVCKIWLIVVCVVSGFLGGFLMGKRTKSRKFLWGMLAGGAYFAILLAVSLILHRGLASDPMHLFATMILSLASGTVGGMVS